MTDQPERAARRGTGSVVVVSDFVGEPFQRSDRDGGGDHARQPESRFEPVIAPQVQTGPVDVRGGYLERLPLALLADGIVERAEIWDFAHSSSAPGPTVRAEGALTRRRFRLDGPAAPFASKEMLAFIEAQGPPSILCVWGLGVAEPILAACADSVKIYNSIDAPALRIPEAESRHFDIVLTGAEWQSAEVLQRHPEMATLVLPIGPEFADPDTFRPLGVPKDYDLIYVAAAQAYKRHDILFDALETLPRSLRTLCVFGYGEMRGELEQRARGGDLQVDFIGPPGVPFDEVNILMNRARIGLVCGIDDGAPAILTEYMLAGLPVLANAGLRCGLQFITPETGATATSERFAEGILALLQRAPGMTPRKTVLERWTWPHSVARLAAALPPRLRGTGQRMDPGATGPHHSRGMAHGQA